ncbi:MAG: Thioesterase-like superfamily, partial [Bacteroidota bacterium]
MIEPAKIQVRITDVDILGHVNNAIYLTYFEIARVH